MDEEFEILDDIEIIDSNTIPLNITYTDEISEFDNLKPQNKSVSICKLIYHLSGVKEKFLIFFGTIGSIISAISGPIMSYTFGGAINDFSDIQDLTKDDINYQVKIDEFVSNIKEVYTRYLILGSILFCSNFLQQFSWQYSAFLQIYKLKENYFT